MTAMPRSHDLPAAFPATIVPGGAGTLSGPAAGAPPAAGPAGAGLAAAGAPLPAPALIDAARPISRNAPEHRQ